MIPLKEYARLIETKLLRMRKALAQALEDKTYAKKEANKWFLIRDYFYKKLTRWKPPNPLIPLGSPIPLSSDSDDSSDMFLRKLDEEAAKQKGKKK